MQRTQAARHKVQGSHGSSSDWSVWGFILVIQVQMLKKQQMSNSGVLGRNQTGEAQRRECVDKDPLPSHLFSVLGLLYFIFPLHAETFLAFCSPTPNQIMTLYF